MILLGTTARVGGAVRLSLGATWPETIPASSTSADCMSRTGPMRDGDFEFGPGHPESNIADRIVCARFLRQQPLHR